MSTTHSRIGASSMHRWAACPASVRLSEGMPNTSSKYAEEGTLAHDLGADLITIELRGNDGGDIADFQEKWKQIDEEMHEAVSVYVKAFLEAAQNAKFVFVEEKFDLSKYHPGLFGTSDGIIYHEETKILQVWDYKHGQGIAVEVENNEQLMYYALGALVKTGVPCLEIEMVICQPRCYHPHGPIRKWRISVLDLLDFSADLIEFAKKTEDPKAPIVPGDHCRFCPASPICPVLQEKALEAAKSEFSVKGYDVETLAKALDLIPAIESWAKSVKEFAFREAQAGRTPPGYKLVPKRATRKWKDPEEVKTTLALEFGLSSSEIFEEPSVKSPTQIESLLDKNQKKELEQHIIKTSSGDTLARVSDKRPESKPAIETEFTKILE